MKMRLDFHLGTLTLSDCDADLPEEAEKYFTRDERSGDCRARACDYAAIYLALQRAKTKFTDAARDFSPLELSEPELTLRPHQTRALNAWQTAGFRGVAAMPTGSGKTILAVAAIAKVRRPTLVLVPTIDLLTQWTQVLERFFRREIGMLGGGSHEIKPLTVSTYDSALLNMEFIGNRFAMLVADECHHLPGAETRLAAAMCIAPYRLGLSATPELPEDRAEVLKDLIGPTVIEVRIDELEGKSLSPYRIATLRVPLDPDEARLYRENRAVYTAFLRRNRITFRQTGDWGRFLQLCARSPEGKNVMRAFVEQRRIARGGKAKLRTLWKLANRHVGERMIIFTADNSTAYDIGRIFYWPVLTHHTKAAERKEFLELFRTGEYPVLVTSKVLNEGVDVPAAAVGVVLSGSGSVREHVQRLGRILRPSPGKTQAVLYELISADTSEENVSRRRRNHDAYRSRRDA